MLKEEFENMIGFEIEYDLYKNWIEKKYYDFKGNKQDFVEHLKENGIYDGLKRMYAPQIAKKIADEKARVRLEKLWNQIWKNRCKIEAIGRKISKSDKWEYHQERYKLWEIESGLEKERLQILHSIYPNDPKYFRARA